jgi:hypothetical protein
MLALSTTINSVRASTVPAQFALVVALQRYLILIASTNDFASENAAILLWLIVAERHAIAIRPNGPSTIRSGNRCVKI